MISLFLPTYGLSVLTCLGEVTFQIRNAFPMRYKLPLTYRSFVISVKLEDIQLAFHIFVLHIFGISQKWNFPAKIAHFCSFHLPISYIVVGHKTNIAESSEKTISMTNLFVMDLPISRWDLYNFWTIKWTSRMSMIRVKGEMQLHRWNIDVKFSTNCKSQTYHHKELTLVVLIYT